MSDEGNGLAMLFEFRERITELENELAGITKSHNTWRKIALAAEEMVVKLHEENMALSSRKTGMR